MMKKLLIKIPIIGPLLRYVNRKRIKYKWKIFNFYKEFRKQKIPNFIRTIIPKSLGLVYLRDNFYTFQPNGGGNDVLLRPLHIKSINDTLPLIEKAAVVINDSNQKEIITIQEFRNLLNIKDFSISDDSELADLLMQYGSDKVSHEYHLIYSAIFHKVKPDGLLEIGLGTNNENIFSNMSRWGHPGASLKAFRDFLPNTLIFGADIDRGILFEEERIKTFFLDQTDETTFIDLGNKLPDQIDIIIDDGLHAPNANIQTLIFALKTFKDKCNKWIIIEDIRVESLVVFKILSFFLEKNSYKTYIIKTKKAHVFACHITKVNLPC